MKRSYKIHLPATLLCGVTLTALAVMPIQSLAQDAAGNASATSSSAAPDTGSNSNNTAAPTPTTGAPNTVMGASAPQTDFGASLYDVSPTAEIGTGTLAAQNYALGPGDMINVSVAPQGKYSAGGMVVTQDGFIDYPVLGRIPANGKTSEALAQDIAARLTKWCIKPDVTVNVVAKHPEVVYVTGGAASLKVLDIHAAPNLLKALTLAGGVSDRNSLSHLVVMRGNTLLHADLYKLWVEGIDNGQNLTLQPGDTIIVPFDTARVTVVGAVNAPGIQPLDMTSDSEEGPERLDVALSRAGSPKGNHAARIGQVTILRHVTPDGKADIYKYDFSKYLKTGDETQNPVLLDNDLIVVPEENHPVSAGNILSFVPFYYLFSGAFR